ncbi:FAD-dependent oxidoreductase [Jiella mangrovi]|uniref:FAD-dependent oxidoreductase n=1 Tax=Jiella mangrovi TaxID=2821407 RepID=A0ABS4BM95_9HYPH|nr:FAD-dependent oxidoreductase [Jiella mangrovi]MBP0617776.1 FAD-dependent oxidoreductase [Jiella mangrovi]
MNTNSTFDVLICGAGAAGLTLAIDLARQGITFRLIEKRAEPFHGSRGKGIQPRTLEVFEDLGILDRIRAAGGSYPKQRQYHKNGRFTDKDVMEVRPATTAEPFRQSLMVPQFLTERVMRERLMELGHQPEFSHELIGFAQDSRGVTARIAGQDGEEVVRLRWLVGADGGRSFVRSALQIGFPGATLGVRAIVADVTLTGLSRKVWHRFGQGDLEKQIFVCPLAGTDLFQLQGPIPLEGDVDLSPEGLTAMLAERTGRDDLTVQDVSWASAFHMNARLADRYRIGHAFLIGDAAHTHPPTGGQGLNTSVQDAYNLGWKLGAVARGAPVALLDSFEEERRPVAQAMLGLSTGHLEAMKRGEMRRGDDVHQLDIGYPGSSLAMEAPERNGLPTAGDRAPDAHVRGAAGQPHRLFDLFAGPHWTLLAASEAGVCARQRLRIHAFGRTGDLVDDKGEFHRAYGLTSGDRVLVRPDGYVGAVVAADETARLEDYLARVGLERGHTA